MTDLRIEKLADLLVNYSVAVRPGDKVVITGETIAEPLRKAIYTCVLKAGGYPTMMTGFAGLDEIFYRYASDDQLQHLPNWQREIISTYDVRISIGAEYNTKALTNVDPEKILTKYEVGYFSNKDFNRMVENVRKLLNNPEQYKTFSHNAYEYVKK